VMALVRRGLVERWPKKRDVNLCSNSARMGERERYEDRVPRKFGQGTRSRLAEQQRLVC